jgi:hypothetical protein
VGASLLAIGAAHFQTFTRLTINNRQLSLPVLFFVSGVVDAFLHG